MLLNKQLELESQQLLNKNNEEIKNYQFRIKQLLYLLRQEQQKFKEEQSKNRKYILNNSIESDKTMIVYSKDVIDELKQEINILAAKLKESNDNLQASINVNNPSNSNGEEYQSLLQKYNQTLERLNIVEKQLQIWDNNDKNMKSNHCSELLTNKIQELTDLDKENRKKLKEAAKKIISLKEENTV